jgi:hypothetical protein
MKFLMNFKLTAEAGARIEARPGGPGPVIQRVMERFKPEALYLSSTAREGWLVADLDTAQVTELMVIFTELSGQHPTFSVVMPVKDFGPVAGPAIAGAHKVLNG